MELLCFKHGDKNVGKVLAEALLDHADLFEEGIQVDLEPFVVIDLI